jgi:hypothetical protein
MWNFSLPYKLKQPIDLSCQRNMLFTFGGKRYGPSLNIEKAFVAFVRGQSDEAGFETVPQPGFQCRIAINGRPAKTWGRSSGDRPQVFAGPHNCETRVLCATQ